MALPTSTIVMALITAVPFGLAIKDTVTGKSAFDLPRDDYRAAKMELEGYSRAQREYEEREAKKAEDLRAAIDTLIPMTKQATLGLRGYALGRAVPDASSEQETLEELAHAVFDSTEAPDGTLKTLTISFPQYRRDENICLLVSQRLEDAWGSSERTYDNGVTRKHWATASTMQRVSFLDPDDGGRCQLVVERVVGVPDFVNKTEASTVPLWAVGKPAAQLVAKLGDNAFSDDTQIRWTALGVGQGVGETELYARIVKGKIVTVTAAFQTSESSIGALAEHMTRELGEPTVTDPVVWTKAKVSLATRDDSAGEYLLVAGAPLPDEE